MCKTNQDSISFPCLYKITHLIEKSYIDDSGDYDRTFYYMGKWKAYYVIIANEKELDDLYEDCAEPDINLKFVCNLSEDTDELKDLRDRLIEYIKKIDKDTC